MASTALQTDSYEPTMFDAALGHQGTPNVHGRRAVFEVFCRNLPEGRSYGVLAGTGRLLEQLETFQFTSAELEWLTTTLGLSAEARNALADWYFDGDIDGYPEGELFFAYSPVLTVECSFAAGLLLETLILSVLNADSAIAPAASRMRNAAGDAGLIEAGGRRTHEKAAISASRAAWIAGFSSTSNLAAAYEYGVPVRGTAAHAFTLAYGNELQAFQAQVAALGQGSTFLVDTYDTPQGIRNAVRAAHGHPGAIRIDSGELASEAIDARQLLDSLGATGTKIIVSGDLDEYRIAEIKSTGAPVDLYEVGTSVVTGSGHPAAGFVYKLVAIAESDHPAAPMRPVGKRSAGKASHGGRKMAWRELDETGTARAELIVSRQGKPNLPAADMPYSRALQVPLVRGGALTRPLDLPEMAHEARRRHATSVAELRPGALELDARQPALTVRMATPDLG